jgi:hypothetical protein
MNTNKMKSLLSILVVALVAVCAAAAASHRSAAAGAVVKEFVEPEMWKFPFGWGVDEDGLHESDYAQQFHKVIVPFEAVTTASYIEELEAQSNGMEELETKTEYPEVAGAVLASRTLSPP